MKSLGIIGAGWLGFPFATQLKSLSYQIIATTRTERRHRLLLEEGIKPFCYELGESPPSVLGKVDTLIIAIPSKDIVGFQHLVDWITKTSVRKVLFISSISVYLNQNQEVFENSPRSDLPLRKIEDIFLQNANFQSTVLRLGGLIGIKRHPGYFFQKSRLVPQSSAPVNLIHQRDCLQIMQQIIQHDIWGEVFNACADTHPTKRDFYGRAARDIDLEIRFSDVTKPYKIVNSSKLKTQLNYDFKYGDLMQIFDQSDAFC
jgi:nucleoside-diphosphate-sugar epimerase